MTVIGLCGLNGVGKTIVADELCKKHGFQKLQLQKMKSYDSLRKGCETPIRMKNLTLTPPSTFDSVDSAVDFVTENWQQNYVITNMDCQEEFDAFLHRPFFMVLVIVAPFSERLKRLDMDDFAELAKEDDQMLYQAGLIHVMSKARLTISNNGSLTNLQRVIEGLSFDEKWLRPSWDAYFMEMANLASHRSNCMKRRVGAIIVKDKRVVATGYNGTARGQVNCNEGGCPRCNSNARRGTGLDHCFCLHAEANALLEAGRVRAEGATIYCTTAPCLNCSQKIVQCGISRVVYDQEYSLDHNSSAMLSVSGITFEKFTLSLPKYIDASKGSFE